jgi:hypothetical protein
MKITKEDISAIHKLFDSQNVSTKERILRYMDEDRNINEIDLNKPIPEEFTKQMGWT